MALSHWLGGAVGGCVATAPMTVTMEGLFRRLPSSEQFPLPPREITDQLLNRLGEQRRLNARQKLFLTLALHFGVGASAGVGYGVIARPWPLPGVIKGAIFGLLVWTTGYVITMPAAKLLRPPTKHPERRVALMIAAHLVYGPAVALITDAITRRKAS